MQPRNEREARTLDRGKNECPACGCLKKVERTFCLSCWRRLPPDVQSQVWASYRDRDLYDHVDFLMRLGNRLRTVGVGPWPEP